MSRFVQGRRPVPGSLAGLLWIGCLTFGPVGAAGAVDSSAGDQARIRELIAARGAVEAMDPADGAVALAARGVSQDDIQGLLNEGDSVETGSAVPDSTEWERVSEAPPEVAAPEATESPVPFGYSLFENSPETYRQPAFGPVDPDYPLGPGDEIVLDVWGDTVFRIERTLDREGAVNLPDAGRVVLAGMTLDEVRRALRQRLSRVYSGLSVEGHLATTHLSVTLGDLRVIRVFVVGRARRPGAYDLSAASTVFHALFFAGGPAKNGSMRDIRVVRGGREIARFDVYDYLRTGRREGDIRLENDDTVFIHPVGPRVTVEGEVREPGIYELAAGETLGDLVETAGGLTEKAYHGRMQVRRILPPDEQAATGEDRRLLDVALAEGAAQPLADGDAVTVFGIPDRLVNFVTVKGEVRRPGTYQLQEGARLSDLLERAGGLLETAFLDRAEVVRTYDDQRREQLAVDLGQALTGARSGDLKLQGRDEITVHSIWSLRDEQKVAIYGSVRSPGQFELRENMTIRDLILQAGGLKENAFVEYAEVSRIDPDEGAVKTAEILRVPLGENYLSSDGADFRLVAYDNVFIRGKPYYELQRNVQVMGEVRFPGTYSMTSPNETLADVIQRAGGLKSTAFPDGFQLFRKQNEIGRVALSLREALKKPSSKDNVVLMAGDSLFVPEEPRTVTVKGEVGYPTSLVYDPGWSIGDYVERAGGATEKADRGQTRVIYTTGAAARVKKFWFDPEVLPGSTIVVPEKQQGDVDWGDVIRDSTSILASLATVALVVSQINN